MNLEEFKKKYKKLKDNPHYKWFCNILEQKNKVLEKKIEENQKLKKAIKEGVIATCETCEDFGICPHSYREYDYKNEVEKLKNQQKEFIEWLENESKNLIRDAGYHQRICLEILSKYKEIIGSDNK